MSVTAARRRLVLAVNRKFFYGWVMVLVAGIGFFACGASLSHLFSVFIGPIARDLGISRTAVSTAYAGASLAAAFCLPWLGRLVDRYGVRRVAFWVTVGFGCAAFAFGQVANLVVLSLGFAALRFLGQGSMMLAFGNLVAQWFSRRRGFALGIVSYGLALSIAVHPPLAQWLVDNTGWRAGWLWIGVITWVVLLPLIVFLVENRPEDLGLVPDGESAGADGGGRSQDSLRVGLTLRQAMATSAFWVVGAGLGTFGLMVTGMFFHQVSVLEAQGVGSRAGAWAFSVSAVFMVACVPLFGRMLDRLPPRRVFAGGLAVLSTSSVALAFASDLPTVLGYAAVFGVANAAMHAHLIFLWPHFFGRRHLGSIQGAALTINAVCSSVGPVPYASVFDLTGSYRPVLFALALLPLVCAAAVLAVREPSLHGTERDTPGP